MDGSSNSPRQEGGSSPEPFPSVYTTVTHEGPMTTTTTTTSNTLQVPASPPTRQRSNSRRGPVPFNRPAMQNRPSTIRIRRVPSTAEIPQEVPMTSNYRRASPTGNRRRSASEPLGPQMLPAIRTSEDFGRPEAQYMASVQEETHTIPEHPGPQQHADQLAPPTANASRLRSASNATRRGLKRMSSKLSTHSEAGHSEITQRGNEYESELTDLLDVVDPEVSTLTTLNNVQNSLFVPDLGWLVNRTPTYNLTRRSTITAPARPEKLDTEKPLPPRPTPQAAAEAEVQSIGEPYTADRRRRRSASITSVLSETHFAVLPHGVRLEGWSEEEKEELNDHVRHLLHSRKEKFRRSMRGFRQYIKKPLGFFVTLYAVLITIFGLVWVLFLIGWISVGGRKSYDENVIDNVLVALFAIMGDGLAPFRAVDTYHMIWIAHYHHLTWRLRREQAMPKLGDRNDLPLKSHKEADLEGKAGADDTAEFSVLSPLQQQRLTHHQNKFSKSHTFYKPHETTTHYAFPLRLLVAVVCLLDCHSLFQIALGTCTWAISYHTRPQALTATILCCSITCNITAGIVITIGDKKTRKKAVIEQMFRQRLTQEAIEKVEAHRPHGEQQYGDDHQAESSVEPVVRE